MTISECSNTEHSSYQIVIKNHLIESDALMGGQKELVIVHQEQFYRLRITSNGKLILTK